VTQVPAAAGHQPAPVSYPLVTQWESPELVEGIATGRSSPADDPRWAASGAASLAEYSFWSWRACGLACLRMLLLAHGHDDVPGVVRLAEAASEAGAFTFHEDRVRGLIYRPFVRWAEATYGARLDVVEGVDAADLVRRVRETGPFIASVHPSIRGAQRDEVVGGKGGHLVLVHHVTSDDDVVLNNPSGWSRAEQKDYCLPVSSFEEYFAGRGMQYRPPSRCGAASVLYARRKL